MCGGVFSLNKIRIILAIGLMVFFQLVIAGPDQESKQKFADLEEQLNYLAVTYDIDIEGSELLKSHPARSVKGGVERQLKVLLSNFNYVAIQETESGIERVIILGRKQYFPDETVLDTRKQGKSHVIEATIIGNNGIRRNISLIVDTGSEYVVLPQSMAGELGLEDKLLQERKLQTANGVVAAKFGQLASLEIGNEIIQNVRAAFVDEKLLGGAKLLGMNVLRHFRFTLDDAEQTITLIKKDGVPTEKLQENVTSESIPSDSTPPESIPPDSIPPEPITPESIPPEMQEDASILERLKNGSSPDMQNTGADIPQ